MWRLPLDPLIRVS